MMAQKITLSLSFLWFFFMAAFAQNPPVFEKRWYENASGDTLPYRILFPPDYQNGQSFPLILFLHGSGERGSENERQLIHSSKPFQNEAYRKKFPAIVLIPQCAKEDYWSVVRRKEDKKGKTKYTFQADLGQPNPSLKMVIELLEKISREEKVDTNRLYVAGLSMGGMGTFEIIARLPEKFAAAIPICGGSHPKLCKRYAKNTSLWIFHGAKDQVVSVNFSRKMVKELRKLQADVRYTEYPDATHNSWDAAFADPDFFPWLFSKRRE